MPIEEHELEELKNLAAQATPGPWRARDLGGASSLTRDDGAVLILQDGLLATEDAAFCAAARRILPNLIAEFGRLLAVAKAAGTEHDQRVRIAREDHSVCDVCWALTDWRHNAPPGTAARRL